MAAFCNSLTSYFPGMLLTYFLNDFEIVPVASIIIISVSIISRGIKERDVFCFAFNDLFYREARLC